MKDRKSFELRNRFKIQFCFGYSYKCAFRSHCELREVQSSFILDQIKVVATDASKNFWESCLNCVRRVSGDRIELSVDFTFELSRLQLGVEHPRRKLFQYNL